MNVVVVYARIYASCAAAAFLSLLKNPWTLLLPLGLGVAVMLAGVILSGLGIAGGFILGLGISAGMSCYLYFLGEVVGRQKASLTELKKSFGVYFWSVINVSFVVWVVNLVSSMALRGVPQGASLALALNLVLLVVLNPAPELIYQRGSSGGLDTISRSFEFLQENWIEWFIPNGLIFAALFGGNWMMAVVFGQSVSTGLLLLGATKGLGVGLVLHVVMVFRGHLFRELIGSTHRQRMFKNRNA